MTRPLVLACPRCGAAREPAWRHCAACGLLLAAPGATHVVPPHGTAAHTGASHPGLPPSQPGPSHPGWAPVPGPTGRRGRSPAVWVAAGVGLVVVLLVVGVVVAAQSARDRMIEATGDDGSGTSVETCAEHFVDAWGPGLASAQGLEITHAVVGLAVVDGSFDAASGIPRNYINQAYQTQDAAGNMLTDLADEHMAEAMQDPMFADCHQRYSALAGQDARVLGFFGCRRIPDGPFRVDCD